jgi:hypothetical protein
VTKIGELGTTQAATSNRRTLRRNTNGIAPDSSETSVLTRATRRNNPEDTIFHLTTFFVIVHKTMTVFSMDGEPLSFFCHRKPAPIARMVKMCTTIRKQTLGDNISSVMNMVIKVRALGTANMWRSIGKLTTSVV